MPKDFSKTFEQVLHEAASLNEMEELASGVTSEGPPERLLFEDVHNLVLGALGDGLDAFLRCVAGVTTQGSLGTAAPSITAEELDSILQGTQRIYDHLAIRSITALDLFNSVCSSVFDRSLDIAPAQLPRVPLPADVTSGSSHGIAESEEELVNQVASLRHELSQVDRRCGQLQAELGRLDRQIRSCGDTANYDAVSSAVVGNKGTVEAIIQRSHELKSLTDEGKGLRAQWENASHDALRGQCRVLRLAATSTASIEALARVVPDAAMGQ